MKSHTFYGSTIEASQELIDNYGIEPASVTCYVVIIEKKIC